MECFTIQELPRALQKFNLQQLMLSAMKYSNEKAASAFRSVFNSVLLIYLVAFGVLLPEVSKAIVVSRASEINNSLYLKHFWNNHDLILYQKSSY